VTINQAYDLIDQLLDKSDQPYFTENEKDDFIRQAIHEFINNHYSKYDIDQVSRDALALFTEYVEIDSDDNDWLNYGVDMPDEYVHLIHLRINYASVSPGPSNPVRAYFRPITSTGAIQALVLRSRSHDECFDDSNAGDGLKEVYQREVIEIAVRKMTGNIESDNYKVALNEQQQSKTK